MVIGVLYLPNESSDADAESDDDVEFPDVEVSDVVPESLESEALAEESEELDDVAAFFDAALPLQALNTESNEHTAIHNDRVLSCLFILIPFQNWILSRN